MHEPVEMTVEECLDLLARGVIGRVAMATPMGPRIVPVNYAMYEDTIVFRTTPYSELGTYGWNTDLAFEIDHLDYEAHQGWSVVAIGRAELVEDPVDLQDIRAHWDPTPWAGGRRHLYIRLRWRDVTGRWVGGAAREGGKMTAVPRAL
ncbi:MAG TPA: pyridoxamine 5'-phosphate oxidase family protein [Nocardioidaceae bacterium]|jgi:nitroimidazol reductase NimA-like FMN-containing flavoprotein (pyridoxamine 5'-phosphate oxidase superfamily)